MPTSSVIISFSVENVARADILLTSSRAFYRFATSDTGEDGSVPYNNLDDTISTILDMLTNLDGDLMPSDVKCEVIINANNSKTTYNNSNISQSCYNSLITLLSQISDEFTFIRGFK